MINTSCNRTEDIKRFCSDIAKDKLLVQGPGGNVSWKETDKMWIKASGTWLADALEKNIFLPVDLVHLKKAIAKKQFDVTPVVLDNNGLRPSIETFLHALMPQTVVVHLHAVEILSLLVCENYIEEFISKVPNELSWVDVEYACPGQELADVVYQALEGTAQPDLIFLRNHGICIGADTIEGVEVILTKVLEGLKFTNHSTKLIKCVAEPFPVNTAAVYAPINHIGIQQLALNEKLFVYLTESWAMYPDHVVFLGAEPFVYDSILAFNHIVKTQQSLPQIVFIKNMGVFAKDQVTPTILEQLICFYEVLRRQNDDKRTKTLTTQQIDQLLNWEAEEYRKKNSK